MERVQENRRGGKGSFALLGEELSWQEGSFLPCPLSVPPLYYLLSHSASFPSLVSWPCFASLQFLHALGSLPLVVPVVLESEKGSGPSFSCRAGAVLCATSCFFS